MRGFDQVAEFRAGESRDDSAGLYAVPSRFSTIQREDAIAPSKMELGCHGELFRLTGAPCPARYEQAHHALDDLEDDFGFSWWHDGWDSWGWALIYMMKFGWTTKTSARDRGRGCCYCLDFVKTTEHRGRHDKREWKTITQLRRRQYTAPETT